MIKTSRSWNFRRWMFGVWFQRCSCRPACDTQLFLVCLGPLSIEFAYARDFGPAQERSVIILGGPVLPTPPETKPRTPRRPVEFSDN